LHNQWKQENQQRQHKTATSFTCNMKNIAFVATRQALYDALPQEAGLLAIMW